MKNLECQKCLNLTTEKEEICSVCTSVEQRLKHFHSMSDDPSTIIKIMSDKYRFPKYKYDVCIGISGGVDSCMVATLAGEAGLRAKLIHFDNGWNTDKANNNIKALCLKYNFHLQTNIMHWDTFKGIQRSFFLASVPDIELVTDHAIFATMIDQLSLGEAPVFLSGANYTTEHGLDLGRIVWNKMDILNIKSINKAFDNVDLSKFPQTNPVAWAMKRFFSKKAKIETPLNNYWYKRNDSVRYMKDKFGFEDYGLKHEESIFTKVYQRVILRNKFNCIKILPHLNAQIRNKEITKAEARTELEGFISDRSLESYEVEFVREKLDFTHDEWKRIQNTKPKCHSKYLNMGTYLEPVMKLLSVLKVRSMD